MKLKNTLTEYGAISRIFHWLSATVLIIQIPLGMYLVDMDFSEKRLTIENIQLKFCNFHSFQSLKISPYQILLC